MFQFISEFPLPLYFCQDALGQVGIGGLLRGGLFVRVTARFLAGGPLMFQGVLGTVVSAGEDESVSTDDEVWLLLACLMFTAMKLLPYFLQLKAKACLLSDVKLLQAFLAQLFVVRQDKDLESALLVNSQVLDANVAADSSGLQTLAGAG